MTGRVPDKNCREFVIPSDALGRLPSAHEDGCRTGRHRANDAQVFGGDPGGRFDFLKKRLDGFDPGIASWRRGCSGRRPGLCPEAWRRPGSAVAPGAPCTRLPGARQISSSMISSHMASVRWWSGIASNSLRRRRGSGACGSLRAGSGVGGSPGVDSGEVCSIGCSSLMGALSPESRIPITVDAVARTAMLGFTIRIAASAAAARSALPASPDRQRSPAAGRNSARPAAEARA